MQVVSLTMAVLPLASTVSQSSIIDSASVSSSQNAEVKISCSTPSRFQSAHRCQTSFHLRSRLALGNTLGLSGFLGFESTTVGCNAYNLGLRSGADSFFYKVKDSFSRVRGVKACASSTTFEEEEKIESVKEGTRSGSEPSSFKTVEKSESRVDFQVGEGGGGGGEGNFGGSGGSGGGGGDSGSSGEEEEEEGKKKAEKMLMSQKFTLGYAALVGVGGVIGYVKSGSSKSVISGALSALLLYYVHTQLPVNPVYASSVGLGISAVLLIVMGSRFKRSGKIFPAGVVSLVSLIMTGGYLHGILRSSHA